MVKFITFLTKVWDAIKPDPYFHIAAIMEMEGYTEDEIQDEIYRLKKANNELY